MLEDRPAEWTRAAFRISTNRAELPLDDVLALLHDTHWAGAMTADVLGVAVRNSVCFGVYEGDRLVGFARAVSDLATYAYLTDVIIAPAARGQGLGEWLVRCILAHPDLQGLRRIALLSRDAGEFYERLGFTRGSGDRAYLEVLGPKPGARRPAMDGHR